MENNKALGERIWDKINLLFPIEIFDEMKRLNISFAELNKIISKYVDFRNEIFGIKIANDNVKLTFLNHEFAFSVSQNFTIWNSNGLTSLGSYCIVLNDPPTDEFINWLYQTVDDYTNDKIHCSDCKRLMDKNNIAGRYFAGVYCDECWNDKWKEIEAAENYG